MKPLKEITEERYYELLECVPPIYISELDGEKVKGAFAVGEANRHANDGRPAYTVCLMKNISENANFKYYEYFQTEAVLSTSEDKPVIYTELHTYSRGNKAQSIQ